MSDITPDLQQPTCRVCLQNNKDEEMSSIFDLDTDCNNLHIYEKIEQCAGIKVNTCRILQNRHLNNNKCFKILLN